jgi:hypothetical protein
MRNASEIIVGIAGISMHFRSNLCSSRPVPVDHHRPPPPVPSLRRFIPRPFCFDAVLDLQDRFQYPARDCNSKHLDGIIHTYFVAGDESTLSKVNPQCVAPFMRAPIQVAFTEGLETFLRYLCPASSTHFFSRNQICRDMGKPTGPDGANIGHSKRILYI